MKYLLFLFVIVAVVARAEPPHDFETNIEFARGIWDELRTGQYDLLESQYADYRDRQGQLQPDGTPRSWSFFWAFEEATDGSRNLEEAGAFAESQGVACV